jgi:hypothetical protein
MLTAPVQSILKTVATWTDQELVDRLAAKTIPEVVLDLFRSPWCDRMIPWSSTGGHATNLIQPIKAVVERVLRQPQIEGRRRLGLDLATVRGGYARLERQQPLAEQYASTYDVDTS